jgi:hypothetical protein
MGFVLLIPLATTGPFMIWNFNGFIESMMISLVRDPSVIGHIYSLDAILGIEGLIGKIPMILMLAGVYWMSYKTEKTYFRSTLLSLFVFVAFNSVFFPSYMVWIIPFIPLAVLEAIQ